MTQNIAIHLDDVTHHYRVAPVLRNLSIRVENGDVVAIVGPNGMGKTTLLKLMAGILTPVVGDVFVHGIKRRSSVEGEAAIRARTVFLPDDAWFPSTKTVREFVLAVGELYGRDSLQAMEHADRLFDLFALSDKSNSSISSCSTGQKKKAALCSALITNAPLMLLDEPFSGGLDPGGIVALKHVLKRFSKSNGGDGAHTERTVVFTTPVPEIIEEVADRVAVIQHGQLHSYGSPEELCLSAGVTTLEKAIDRILHTDTLDRLERYFVDAG